MVSLLSILPGLHLPNASTAHAPESSKAMAVSKTFQMYTHLLQVITDTQKLSFYSKRTGLFGGLRDVCGVFASSAFVCRHVVGWSLCVVYPCVCVCVLLSTWKALVHIVACSIRCIHTHTLCKFRPLRTLHARAHKALSNLVCVFVV